MISPASDTSALLERLRCLEDPEVGLNIVDLGMVYSLEKDATGHVRLGLLPTTPHCPMQEQLVEGAKCLLQDIPGVTQVDVHVVLDQPWSPERITPEGRAFLHR